MRKGFGPLIVGLGLSMGLVLAPYGALQAQEPTLSWEVLFGPEAHGRRPRQLAFDPTGERLLYEWEGHLRLLSTASGDSEVLVRLADLDLPGRTSDVGDLQWTSDGGGLLFTHRQDLYLLDVESRAITRLTETAEREEEDAQLLAHGKGVVFVRGEDLYHVDLQSRRETRLTHDGEANKTLNGKTDWVYWEEIWGRSSMGFWPSPSGDEVAYYRFDETPVPTYPLVNFLPTYPQVTEQKYPKAGEANPKVQVGVLDRRNGKTVWMKTEHGDGYLGRVTWTPEGDALAIHRINRDQNRLDLLLCHPRSGDCREVLREETRTWVDLTDDFAFLADGRLIWGSDRSGWRRLYLYKLPAASPGGDGEEDDGRARLVRELTPEGISVTSLDGVHEEAGWLLYTGYRTDTLGAAERQVYRVELENARHRALASDAGWNTATAARGPGGISAWIHTWSDQATPPVVTLRRGDGSAIATLPSKPPRGYDPKTLPQWRFFTVAGAGGVEFPARILEPSGAPPAGKRPVLMYHYGCPASQVVENRWRTGPRDLWHRRMAEKGYLVLMVDNEASLFFGKRGAEKLHRSFGPLELAAQVAAVEYLKSRPDVDPERIGLWGWSGGGSNTLYSVFRRPGLWRAAVAGAPVTDWRLYDTIWTERYLDHPRDNPEGYRTSSPITFASQLADALLVIHGTADDNVHPQNTLKLVQELIEAEIPFEDAIYPRQKHGFRGPHMRHLHRRMEAFFDRHLR